MATRRTKAAPPRRRPTVERGPGLATRLLATMVRHRRLLTDVAAVLSLIAGIICGLALAFPSGWLTQPLQYGLSRILGWTAALVPIWLIGLGVTRLVLGLRGDERAPAARLVGAVLASLALPALAHLLPSGEPDPMRRAFEEQ